MVHGLVQLQPEGNSVHWTERSGIFCAQAKDILSWQDSIIVIASQGEGVILIKDDEFWPITSENGLPSDINGRFSILRMWCKRS